MKKSRDTVPRKSLEEGGQVARRFTTAGLGRPDLMAVRGMEGVENTSDTVLPPTTWTIRTMNKDPEFLNTDPIWIRIQNTAIKSTFNSSRLFLWTDIFNCTLPKLNLCTCSCSVVLGLRLTWGEGSVKAGRASFDLGVASGPLGGGADDNSSEGRRQGVASRREGVMLLDWALGTIGRASPLPAINTGIDQNKIYRYCWSITRHRQEWKRRSGFESCKTRNQHREGRVEDALFWPGSDFLLLNANKKTEMCLLLNFNKPWFTFGILTFVNTGTTVHIFLDLQKQTKNLVLKFF